MTHIPLRDGQLYVCPACRWRAVLTTRGLLVTEHGDAGASHRVGHALSEADRREWIYQVVTRIRTRYSDAALRRHLIRCVMMEYGDE